jgi:hypothetical protein
MPENPTSGTSPAQVETIVYIPLANGESERKLDPSDNFEPAVAGVMDPYLPIQHIEQPSMVEIDSAPLEVKSNLHSSNNSLNKERETEGAEYKRNSTGFVSQVEEKKRKKCDLSRTKLIVAKAVSLMVVLFLVGLIIGAVISPHTSHRNNVIHGSSGTAAARAIHSNSRG